MRRCILAVLLPLLLAAVAPTAHALQREVEAQFDSIVDYNYRGSAVTSPPPCDAVCQQLRNAEIRAGGTAAGADLATEARNLRASSRLLPALNIGSKLLKVGGPLGVAVLIGDVTGANSKLLELIFPPAGGGGSGYCASCTQSVRYFPYGTPSPDWNGPSYPLDEGAVFAWTYSLGSGYKVRQVPDGPEGPACDGDPAPPADFHILDGPSNGLRCSPTPVASQAAYLLPSEVLSGPMTDYAGEPYDARINAPSDPGRSNVETDTRDALESDEFPKVGAMLEHELGVEGACDPGDTNVCNQPDRSNRCDLTPGGMGSDPLSNVSTEWFAPAQYEVVNSFQRRTPSGGLTDTALRVGWTKELASDKKWAGWGYRHVVAKHGWSLADQVATGAALGTPPVKVDRYADGTIRTLIYQGSDYIQNGFLCRRQVVVGPQKVDPEEPAPKEIITSYGLEVDEAPLLP